MSDNTREGVQAEPFVPLFGWCVQCDAAAEKREARGPQGLCMEHFVAEYECEVLMPDREGVQAVSLNEPIKARCSTHPEREAVAENDMRTSALCRECYDGRRDHR